MNNRAWQMVLVAGMLASPWLAAVVRAVPPPPILNLKMQDADGVYYMGAHDTYSGSCYENEDWQSPWAYYEGECYPRIDVGCQDICTSYVAFSTWYYQDCLLHANGEPRYCGLDMEDAPLYGILDGATAAYGARPYTPIDIQAKLYPIHGLDALRYIPVDVCRTLRPPIAAARYGIRIEMPDTPLPENTVVGALFWITAIYDPSVFDVRISYWDYQYVSPFVSPRGQSSSMLEEGGQTAFFATGGVPHFTTGWDTYLWGYLNWLGLDSGGARCRYHHQEELPSGSPLMFTDGVRLHVFTTAPLRRNILPITPDYVTIRLKDSHRLEDLGSRKVQLILHTLSWIGDSYWCSPNGDALRYSRTSSVFVGADLAEKTDDWSLPPSVLKEECVPPSFSKTEVGSAEADVIGTKVVNDLNVELPSMQVGKNRCKVSSTLATTLANDAVWYPFGYGFADRHGRVFDTGGVVVFNLKGVWCCVDDVPGLSWDWGYDPSTGSWALGVVDEDSRQIYAYLTTDNDANGVVTCEDYAYRPAKLKEVCFEAYPHELLREYGYIDNDITQPLDYQVDREGNCICYGYLPVDNGNGNDLQVTMRGNDERDLVATFAAWPTVPGDYGTCPLLTCSKGSGSSWRQYQWYQPGDTPAARDGKLQAVKDAAGNVLAAFEYDDRGRLIRQTRGAASQPVAEYEYPSEGAPGVPGDPPPEDTTMDAKFYVDDEAGGRYQLVRRTFNPQGLVTQIEEFHDLQEDGSETGTTSITTFDYCDPPAQCQTNLFYLSINGYRVGRCLIKTLPPNESGHSVAEYTQYDPTQGWNILQTFLAPPVAVDPSGAKIEPAAADRRNWTAISNYAPYDGAYVPVSRIDKSRSSPPPSLDDAITFFYYNNGYLDFQIDPEVKGVDGRKRQRHQWWTYAPADPTNPGYLDFRKIKKYMRSGPNGGLTVTEYWYDSYGNVSQKSEGWAPYQGATPTYFSTWTYQYNAFGQKELEIDPDGYCHQTDYAPGTGLLASTCTYADPWPALGLVIRQTKYEYYDETDPSGQHQNGMLKRVRVANSPVPFPKDPPDDWDGWIDTTYTYDIYGRLTAKTMKDPATGADLVTRYEYDRQDRLVKVTWPDGRWKQITRDGRGQIVQIDYHGTGQETLTSTYTYDDAGNLIRRTTQGCPECGPLTEYKYDEYNRRIKEIRRGS